MNGAEALIASLAEAGVDVVFANPGTSEMQLVAAIDGQAGMRAVLGLFEGVVTGAADGYGRIADTPAATLLHLGPGLGNGLANLHNARRAGSPIVNLVGDHASDHLHHDAPLTSDVAGVARPMSDWVGRSRSASDLPAAGMRALAAARSEGGGVATLIVPADHAWSGPAFPATAIPPVAMQAVDDGAVSDAAEALRAPGSALFLGGRALRADALDVAGRIAAATGATLVCETFCARIERGVGRVPVEKLPYFGEVAADFLSKFNSLVFVGAEPPVSFFAYPDKPGWLSPEQARLVRLAGKGDDALAALLAVADRLDARSASAALQPPAIPEVEAGKLTASNAAALLAHAMPEQAIICEEAATAGVAFWHKTAGAAPHDWLMLTGGAIGQGLPLALGAAIAAPHRKVIALQADGGGMYTLQALWSMARERANVTTIILNNGSYAILNIELMRVGVTDPGPKARAMLDLRDPPIDWTALATGMGVEAVRASDTEQFGAALDRAIATVGPFLIEAMI